MSYDNPRPLAARLIDVVELRWYTEAGTEPPDLAASYLALARQLLPEAVPRHFGGFEPLDAALDVAGDAAFVSARDGEDTVFFKGTFPCFAGSLGASRPRFVDGPVRGHTLTVDRATLDDPARRRALQAFFVRFALSGKAFFATAEVQRGVRWDGRALEFGTEAEPLPYRAPRGQWQGPPSYPVWWSWSTDGRATAIDVGVTRLYDGATLHAWTPAPADRDQLAALRS